MARRTWQQASADPMGVAIGPGVRSQYEPVTLLDLMKNILQHRYAFF